MPSDCATAKSAKDRRAPLLQSLSEGGFGVALKGRCTIVNLAAVHRPGRRTELVPGRNMHKLLLHDSPTSDNFLPYKTH
jgi:hypothetical protein